MFETLCFWFSKFFGVILIMPHPIAIGNSNEEIYYGFMRARKEKKKIIILCPYNIPGRLHIRIANKEIRNIDSEYKVFNPNTFFYKALCFCITLYFAFFRGIHLVVYKYTKLCLPESLIIPMFGQRSLWKPELSMTSLDWDLVNEYDWTNQSKQYLNITLPEAWHYDAKRFFNDLQIPNDAWYVCLHVREGGYYNDHHTSERNANIENYILAIKEITKRGGWVIRMGDSTMKKLPMLPQVIDYPFTSHKSEKLDLYLIKNCALYIGMQSGILEVAILFQKPIIQTNMYSWFLGFPQKEKDLGILKRVYCKKTGSFLRPIDWPNYSVRHNSFWPREEYEFHENTPSELEDVVKEYFNRPVNWNPSSLQIEFNELRLNSALSILEKPLPGEEYRYDSQVRYRLAARVQTANGYLSNGSLITQSKI